MNVNRLSVAHKFRIAETDNVARSDLVELLGRGVGEVGVDGGAVGARADGEEGVGGEEREDEGVCAAAGVGGDGGGVGGGGGGGGFGRGVAGDDAAELVRGGFELVLARGGGWAFVALFEGGVGGVGGVEADADDGLGVVHVEDVDVFGDGGFAAAFG